LRIGPYSYSLYRGTKFTRPDWPPLTYHIFPPPGRTLLARSPGL
jgi:hypothetical protein